MPSEVSIAKPLSGTESLDACLNSLRIALSKDDRFSSHMAYTGFRAVIDFKFYPVMTFVPDVERVVEVTEGEGEPETEPTVTETVEIPVRPPNQVREEADMPQPVLVTDSKGQGHEEWKRVAKASPKGAVPKNKIRGA
jgi:hypothetical protein